MPDPLPEFTDTAALITWLSQQRNDLEAPACAIAPVIGDVLAALEALEGCGLARMSGSGATCFGLFVEPRNAEAAADRLQRDHPKWWIKTGVLGDQSEAAMPVIS
jgi:4-diphosphocytidyl-2-C-methyl-D-erythritol kinase